MIELRIEQRRRDLGGFEAGRVLPYRERRMVGPFANGTILRATCK